MFSSNRVFANRFEVVLVGTPQEISDGLYDVDIYQALHNVNSPLERNIQVAHRVFTDYLESVEKVNGRFFVFYKKVEVTPSKLMSVDEFQKTPCPHENRTHAVPSSKRHGPSRSRAGNTSSAPR